MKVLFAAMEWDYGDPSRGKSFEFTNMFDAMRRMPGVQTRLYDFMVDHQRGGAPTVKDGLTAAVRDFDPDLAFFVLFKDEVPADVLVELRDAPRPVTFNWFCDDHWRFDDFSCHWAPLFNGCSTTATSAVPKYRAMGMDHVLKTQWACNLAAYTPASPVPLRYDVTFVGQPHGTRRRTVEVLRHAGLEVQTWGHGWESGRLSQEEMVDTFAASRINLNLSNASVGRRWRHPRTWFQGPAVEQIKGRNFEIPGAGGFQLSGRADDIESYFDPGVEIVLADGDDELVALCQRYLADEPSRSAIALAGRRRVEAEHTYAHRYREIFDHLGLA